jgi:hypothetical protein
MAGAAISAAAKDMLAARIRCFIVFSCRRPVLRQQTSRPAPGGIQAFEIIIFF